MADRSVRPTTAAFAVAQPGGPGRGLKLTHYPGVGVLALAILVAVLGPAITQVPLNALRVVVGGLLAAVREAPRSRSLLGRVWAVGVRP